MTQSQRLHEQALRCAKSYLKTEFELLTILQKIDDKKVFRDLGYSSLFRYATEALKLSESQAYNFINVSRKGRDVPQLITAISSGKLSVSKARKIVPVIKKENQKEWIEKASTLAQREIERAVASSNPSQAVSERIRIVAKERCELKVGLSSSLEKKLRRVQNLVSQRKKTAMNLERTLEVLIDDYLNRRDPIQKAKRIVSSKKPPPKKQRIKPPVARQLRRPIPAGVRHQVNLRDQGKCRFKTPEGVACLSERWIDLHHRVPVSRGGDNSAKNLITLCRTHHEFLHKKL